LPDFEFNYGDNHIEAKGNVEPDSQKLTAKVLIDAPDLSGLVPELDANIVGNVNVSGKLLEPNASLDIKAKSFHFQDLHLQDLVAKGNVTSNEIIEGNINLSLAAFNYGESVNVNAAHLTIKGSEKHHELQLTAQGDPVGAVLNISGGFDRTSQVWKGNISNTNIQSLIGDLKNTQTIPVTYDNKTITATVGAHCWQTPHLDLCFPQTFKAGKIGEIPFDIKRLNLSLVNELTQQEGLLKGSLTSQGKVAWFENKPPQVAMTLNGNGVNIAQKVNGRNLHLALPKMALNAQLANNNLTAKTDIQLEQQAKIETNLTISDLAKARKLSGEFNLHGLNLNLAKQLLTRSENIEGNVNAHLTFGGDLTSPLLNGQFSVTNIKAKSASMPFNVQQGEVLLHFNGRSSRLQGHITTNDNSRLALNGEASWKDINSWTGQVHAKAHEFYLDIPNMARLKLSPDISAKATPKLLELTGEVDVPWARIVVEALPESAVSVSSDEVILGEGSKNQSVASSMAAAHNRMKMAAEADGMAIRSDLKIKIGKDVTLDAYGLKTNLGGLLSVQQQKGQLGLYGQIHLFKGRFASYGQDLLIRKGQISFSGLPSQPFLNIEAIRNPEAMEDSAITAGVKVTGSANSPEVQVFSEPSMPQDQALSYLLTGRSLENSGEAGSAGSVGAALLGMSLSKSGKAVGKIGETFGISDLSLGTSGVGDSSKVTVSGNITDRLQIKYGVGLFDGLAEITLRYRLLPRLYLQSVSGVNQAFDLLYQFQF